MDDDSKHASDSAVSIIQNQNPTFAGNEKTGRKMSVGLLIINTIFSIVLIAIIVLLKNRKNLNIGADTCCDSIYVINIVVCSILSLVTILYFFYYIMIHNKILNYKPVPVDIIESEEEEDTNL